jgi:hypothetical protein
MSRVINTNSPNKVRNQARRTIAEILRLLSTKPRSTTKLRIWPLMSSISLREIDAASNRQSMPGRKRGYWMKAERFLRDWEWPVKTRQTLRTSSATMPGTSPTAPGRAVSPASSDIQIKKITRSPADVARRARAPPCRSRLRRSPGNMGRFDRYALSVWFLLSRRSLAVRPEAADHPTLAARRAPTPSRALVRPAQTPDRRQRNSIRAGTPASTPTAPARRPHQHLAPARRGCLRLLSQRHRGRGPRYRLYLPPCYGVDGRVYPTLYLFAGNIHNEGKWAELGIGEAADEAIAAGEIAPLLIVMPAGGWLADETSGGPGSYESLMLDELIPHVEATSCAWPEPAGKRHRRHLARRLLGPGDLPSAFRISSPA